VKTKSFFPLIAAHLPARPHILWISHPRDERRAEQQVTWRLCCLSENGGSTTAPSTPPANIKAPSVPASVGVNPRGRAGDRGIGDPQHLNGQVDEHENSQHHPAVGVETAGFFGHVSPSENGDIFLMIDIFHPNNK
jgi:hypothetical protein